MEQDQYEARLKELFDSFDTTGTGSLGQEELTDLCITLQLEDVASSLQQALLQDNPHGRVHFDQFKEALIDVLSSKLSDKDSFEEADGSAEVQPKYIKDGKRYGRRSVPELQDSLEEFDEDTMIEPEDEGTRSPQLGSRNCDALWKSQEGEEYEAEGQLRFWNPDDLNASQTVFSPTQDWVEEKLQLVCEDLGITRDGHLNRKKLISICEQYGFQNVDKETLEDAFQNLDQEDTISLQDFFSNVCRNAKPLTPSASTPYRHLKRHLSMQPYDESGRRTITPSAMTGYIGFRLFSKLDDGSGYGSVEDLIDMWQEDGVENSQAILKALDFNLEGKINLTELTMTLENELLMTKNEVYQAALASFRSEIRHLLESAEQASREKEKLRSDLEKNERFKSLMASEVDDHHAAIERRNEYNLRKLDEEYKERMAALRSELRKEREQILQQTSRQRQELELELDKTKTEENILRDRVVLTLKENSRLENELLETSEKLIEYETLTSKLQKSLDNVLREKFGDLDPSCIEFFHQEEKLAQMRNEYERQRRELQDRIDELQLELEEYRLQGVRGLRSPVKNSLSFEMDGKNAVECDQGIGSEECPPLNMSIEAEMAIEQMREQHQREVERLNVELESKASHYEDQVKEVKSEYKREQEMVQLKSIEEVQRIEEQVGVLKARHGELEANIVKLKEEHQVEISKHRQKIGHIEADLTSQRIQVTERETSHLCQLNEAQRAFHEEKEKLTQRAMDLENKLVEVVRTLQEEKEELEHNLKEEMSSCQERLEFEKNELVARLMEEHQNELREERKKLDTENRRILEMEDQLTKECEYAVREREEALRGLEEKFQSAFRELLDRQDQEQAKWQLEKAALVEERDTSGRKVQDIMEKSMACSALAEEKDLPERNYSECLNKLITEKEESQKALEQLKVTAKKEKRELSRKILQLENDLKEELTERDEQLGKVERNAQILQESLEKQEQKHKTEKEELNYRLQKSEALYIEACNKEKLKEEETFVEISKLQSTIIRLQDEITTLSKLHGDLKSLEKENSELRVVVSPLQGNAVDFEEGIKLGNLQTMHEETIRENVRLAAEISGLKDKLATIEHDVGKVSKEENLKLAHEEVGVFKILTERNELLCQSEKTVEILRENIERLKQKHKTEKEELNAMLLNTEMLYKEACDLEKSKKEEMLAEISTLQHTIHGLQNEIATLSKLHSGLKSLEQENVELKTVVSQLQENAVLQKEEQFILKNLQNAHEQTVKENVRLTAEMSRLQKKLDLLACSRSSRTSEAKGSLPIEVLDVEKSKDVYGDSVTGHHMESSVDVNQGLFLETEKHECVAQMVRELEQCYEDNHTKNGLLRERVLHLQEDLNHLALEYDHLSETNSDFECSEFEEALIGVPGLKMLLAVAKKENLHLLENLKVMKLKNKEAVENNRALSSEVSWLQKEIHSMQEMAEASLKLENLYEAAKIENQELKMLIPKLQENINELSRISILKHTSDKEIQASGVESLDHCEKSLQHLPSSRESQFLLSPQSVPHSFIVENCYPWHKGQRADTQLEQISDHQGRNLQTKHSVVMENGQKEDTTERSKADTNKPLADKYVLRRPQDPLDCPGSLQPGKGPDMIDKGLQNENGEMRKNIEALRCENEKLKDEKSNLKLDISNLEEECEICQQKMTELQEACEEMWVNLETVQNEKAAVQNLVEGLTKQVSELKTKNHQLESQNAELFVKNTKNQSDVEELNQRLMTLLKQRGKKESKGLEEWQREKGRLKDEMQGYKSKVTDSEKELCKVKARSHLLEQENVHLKQEMETKQLLKSSDLSNLKKEVSALTMKNEHLLKEKETLNEELNKCVEKCAKVGFLESKIASLKQEQNSWKQQSQGLKGQLASSQEKIQSLEENLKSVNTQMSQIRSDLRVAQQEKEALKQEVMSLHKQLQNANAKNQVLEMAVHSSGLQNNQKKLYWDDLEKLMEQEQKLLRQENERLLREFQNTKTDLLQSREKVRQLESMVLTLKHEKQQSHASVVRGLEQEKSSLRRECDQLQKELESAHRKISQMSSFNGGIETKKTECEGIRSNVGKFNEDLIEALRSASSVALSHSPLQQQAAATSPKVQYLPRQQELQQADRRNQQPHATSRSSDSNSQQSDQEQLLRRMETRMLEVEQKLRIVKMLLQEKVNQLKEQFARNTKADAKIKDLHVENSQLLKALAMSEQRHQTAVKKNYLLEEKISGLNKIVRDLSPSALPPGRSPQLRPL